MSLLARIMNEMIVACVFRTYIEIISDPIYNGWYVYSRLARAVQTVLLVYQDQLNVSMYTESCRIVIASTSYMRLSADEYIAVYTFRSYDKFTFSLLLQHRHTPFRQIISVIIVHRSATACSRLKNDVCISRYIARMLAISLIGMFIPQLDNMSICATSQVNLYKG